MAKYVSIARQVLFGKKIVRKEFNEDAPSWMKKFIEDDSVNWMGLFGYCSSKDVILRDWESFILRLFSMSHCADKGYNVINRVQESYERNKLSTRIYESLTRWKQKCFTDDVEMFNLFAEAYKRHISLETSECIVS